MVLQQSKLISLLNKVFRQTAYIRKDAEAIYHCPFCNHYKKKLEINTISQSWHCWVCNAAGKSIRSLFRKLKVSRPFYNELYEIVGGGDYNKSQSAVETIVNLSLPDEFLPLSKPTKSLEYGNAINYLRSRKVTRDDILRYNIGYAEQGEYRQRIIIPSYDKGGNINFFSSRTYYDNSDTMRYKNPPWSKNIVGFELFINWDLPITITEGALDALAIRRNAIPLFGTLMSDNLKQTLIKNGVWQVNIVLDSDAIKKAINIYEFLERHEIEAKLIKLEDKDPSMLGFQKITEIIHATEPMDFSSLIAMKMSI
jgi:DNA primase